MCLPRLPHRLQPPWREAPLKEALLLSHDEFQERDRQHPAELVERPDNAARLLPVGKCGRHRNRKRRRMIGTDCPALRLVFPERERRLGGARLKKHAGGAGHHGLEVGPRRALLPESDERLGEVPRRRSLEPRLQKDLRRGAEWLVTAGRRRQKRVEKGGVTGGGGGLGRAICEILSGGTESRVARMLVRPGDTACSRKLGCSLEVRSEGTCPKVGPRLRPTGCAASEGSVSSEREKTAEVPRSRTRLGRRR